MAKNKSSSRGPKVTGANSSRVTDPRFANFETDPRFRLPSRKKGKITLDERFASVFRDDEFTKTAKVDRYGRKLVSDKNKKALQRLYQLEGEEDDSEDDDEIDDDAVVRRELEAAEKNYDPARGGGFSSSESSDDEDSDEEDEVEGEQAVKGMQRIQDEAAKAEEGEVTNRIAIVSLDWDNIKSTDLFALFSSFLPAGGRIEKISIYPSEFGKERMAQEETSGPPQAIWKGKGSDSEDEPEEDDEEDGEDEDEKIKKQLFQDQEGDAQDFDMDRLREYQLDRLRYYYAVMVCSDKQTAKEIYDKTDGTELLSSSNHLDLRFVPDDVTFDDDPRDECNSVPTGYKPVEFTTRALNHSKVELTWDMDPEASRRTATMHKAFTGSRADINENDLRAYLGSDSSDNEEEEEEEGKPEAAGDGDAKLSKKELARRKMRAALGLPDEPTSKTKAGAGPVGDMQVTFTPALSESAAAAKKDAGAEETTVEKYIRKEKERKAKRKEKAVAKREGRDPAEPQQSEDEAAVGAQGGDDLGFDDPFFATTDEPPQAPSKSSVRKEERLKKRAAKEAEAAASAAERAKLELLMADDMQAGAGEKHLDHFDMREIERAEKQKRRKVKKGKKGQEEDGTGLLQEDFKIDVDDPRFQAVFENHEFAIDPSNPKFKASQGMKKLLEEGRKRRRNGGEAPTEEGRDGDERKKKKRREGAGGEKGEEVDVERLVKAVKKKARGERT